MWNYQTLPVDAPYVASELDKGYTSFGYRIVHSQDCDPLLGRHPIRRDRPDDGDDRHGSHHDGPLGRVTHDDAAARRAAA